MPNSISEEVNLLQKKFDYSNRIMEEVKKSIMVPECLSCITSCNFHSSVIYILLNRLWFLVKI